MTLTFTSYHFVIFAAGVIAAYNTVPQRFRVWLLLGSTLAFYSVASLSHLLTLAALASATHWFANRVGGDRRRATVAVAVCALVAPLAALKYLPALAGAGSSTLSTSSEPLNAIVPLGLSFLTLQCLAYVIDVYRGETLAEPRWDLSVLYLTFFPKLLAGPVERARDLLPQLRSLQPSRGANLYAGLKWMLWGFFCKLAVADNIGSVVDALLEDTGAQSGSALVVGFSLYSFQIYFDLLGYTNIAIGVARCFNVRLNANFRVPYAATSLQDFWRRWHISVSTWFRDYVYVPLGGGATRGLSRVRLVLVVFLVSGFWHGATAGFLLWGIFHGLAFVVEEQIRSRVAWARWLANETRGARVARDVGQRVLTFGVVTVGWIFFRTADVASGLEIVTQMAGWSREVPYGLVAPILTRPDTWWFVVILTSAIVLDSSAHFRSALNRVPAEPRQLALDLACVNWMVVLLVLLGDLGVRDFTYFSF